MATIKDIKIYRERGTRPTGNVDFAGAVWFVEKGEKYDLVQFSINELDESYYWCESLYVPCGKTEEELREMAKQYAENSIYERSIKDYERFLEDGKNWGWD